MLVLDWPYSSTDNLYNRVGSIMEKQDRMTLTLGLPEQMFQLAYLLIMENNCAHLYWNPSKIVGVMVQTKIWPLSVSLTLGLPEQMFQMAHLHVMEQLCQITCILKSIHNCRSYGRDKFKSTHTCNYTRIYIELPLWQLHLAHRKLAQLKAITFQQHFFFFFHFTQLQIDFHTKTNFTCLWAHYRCTWIHPAQKFILWSTLELTIGAKIYYCDSIDIGKNTITIVLILPVTTAILLHELHKIKIGSCFVLIPFQKHDGKRRNGW